ncbi:hypothetical protein [Elioraea rosea]|uniref:hypothetical protein n=1 Tax=Elioraea rosea TaxID=2492390 RepID=UPI001183B68C|nr:hypothetical protein [Elioraea rosea]
MAEPVEDDIGLQRTFWRIQRLGWACMAAIVAASVVGMFGDGRLAEAAIRVGDVSMAYERIQRTGRESRVLVRNGGAVPVLATFAGPAVARLNLADQPGTVVESLAEDTLRIALPAGGTIAIRASMRSAGLHRATLDVAGLPPRGLRILVLP